MDRIRQLDTDVYEDVLFLLAVVYAMDADNDELRQELNQRPAPLTATASHEGL